MSKTFLKKDFINEFLIDPDTNSYNTGDDIDVSSNNQIKSNNTTDFNAMQVGDHSSKYNRFGYFFEQLISNKNVSEFVNDDTEFDEKYLKLVDLLVQNINKKDDDFKIKFIVKLVKDLNVDELDKEDKSKLLKKLVNNDSLI